MKLEIIKEKNLITGYTTYHITKDDKYVSDTLIHSFNDEETEKKINVWFDMIKEERENEKSVIRSEEI